MSVSPDFIDFVLEMLEPVGAVSAKRMFGGAGVFINGVMFGLLDDDRLYFRVDDQTRPDYEAEGSGPFRFVMKGDEKAMTGYYEAPEHLLDDAPELVQWADRAAQTAFRIKAAKTRKKKN